jgi:hypothetical protein
MDPRGVGAWNMRSLSQIEEAVWAMDYLEAGKEGKVCISLCFAHNSLVLVYKKNTFICSVISFNGSDREVDPHPTMTVLQKKPSQIR